MTSFTLFRFLPPELRRMIWKLCLPNRAVEVQKHFHIPLLIDCQSFWYKQENSIPPVLTRVCHESRSIALETGRPLAQHQDPPLRLIKGTNWKACFDPKTDTLISSFDYVDIHNRCDHTFVDPIAYHEWFARRGRNGMIMADRFSKWCPDEDGLARELNLREHTVKGICKRKEYLVALQVLPVHTDLKHALDSQLFGLLGDSPIQIMDPYDTDRLQKFLKLCNPEDKEVEIFIDMAADKDGFKESVDQWSVDLVRAWIWYQWTRITERSDMDIPNPETVWIGSRWSELGELPNRLEAHLHPNMNHPWVQDTVNDMPHFRPTLMFCLCILNCTELDYPWFGIFTQPDQMTLAEKGYEQAKRDKQAWEKGEL